MRRSEDSMDWMSFADRMRAVAQTLSSSDCPMVLVLPDGREIRFSDVDVDTFGYRGKRGDAEFDSVGFRVKLLDAEIREGKAEPRKKRKTKTTVEFAIQRRTNGRYEDIDKFNNRTCGWGEPVSGWLDRIVEGRYFWGRAKDKFKSARIVKRVTTEEVVLSNNKGANNGSR